MKKILLTISALICLAGCTKIDTDSTKEQEEEATQESALPTLGNHSYLVVLVETSDVHFSIANPNQAFSDMLNKKGYGEYGGTGSVKDYFTDQSTGKYVPTFDVYGPVQVDLKMSNFTAGRGLGKIGAPRLLAMACDKLDPEVDFSKYDTNNNGIIDNVFFYFAGYNSAEGPDDAIWPHAGVVEYKKWVFDGVKLLNYACTSELRGSEGTQMARIGNFCHEFAHVLGLPDLYDTKTGKADGLGDFSLMHSGCYNNNGNTPPSLNCEERILLGWMDEIPEIPQTVQELSIAAVSSNKAYKTNTNNPGEYFCYEYRNGTGWDAYIPKGLLIYHIDKSQNDVNGRTAAFRWKYLLDLNGYPSHECFDLVKASESSAVFGNGVNEFTPIAWNGDVQTYCITDITIGSSSANIKITR